MLEAGTGRRLLRRMSRRTHRGGGDASYSTDGVTKPSQPPSIVDSHDCDVCGKSFPSYQALDGHKSRYRNKTSAAAAVTVIPASNCTSCGPHTSGGFHQCRKGYATGQALGGIRLNGGRNSLDGGNGDLTSVVSYSGSDGEFDLNKPPHSPGLDLTLKL